MSTSDDRIAAALAQKVYVDGDWKMLADCTADEVLRLARRRQRRAKRLGKQAAELRRLAEHWNGGRR